MQAAQWDPKQQKIVVNDLPIPEAGAGQFIVKISAASLCHSDLMALEVLDRQEPVTLGHEGVGVIQKIDAAAENKGFKVGDTIGFLYIIGACFECEACQHHNLLCHTGNQLLQGFTAPGSSPSMRWLTGRTPSFFLRIWMSRQAHHSSVRESLVSDKT